MNIDLTKVYKSIAASGSEPQVEIQSHINLDSNTIKVVASVNGVKSEADFETAVNAMTAGKGRVIPGSFNMKGRIAVATIASNIHSKPMDASFTMLTASTAMDAGGTIWSVVNDGDHKRVVLESSDDLNAILLARQAARRTFASPSEGAGLATASFKNGDLVRFVDTSAKDVKWGFVFDTVDGVQVAGETLDAKTIDPQAIVATVSHDRLDETARKAVEPILATAKLDSAKFAKIMAYLHKAYPTGPVASELFAKYSKLAREAK